jgi:hypothetical protein
MGPPRQREEGSDYYCLSATLMLALASTVMLGSEFHGTHNHISLSDGYGSLQTTPFSQKN